jgi:DNA-directed RNA polymerase specialized sigma24 family protein
MTEVNVAANSKKHFLTNHHHSLMVGLRIRSSMSLPSNQAQRPARLFPTTSGTLITRLRAEDASTRETSVARFCLRYYPAIYGYARSMGLKEHDAQDRVQDFFFEVVRDDLLRRFDPGRGTRLSTWLISCFRKMEASHRTAASALKRGGGHELVEFDPEHAEHSYQAAHLAHLAPEPTFDLMLAREIWRAARARLQQKHDDKGNGALVRELLPVCLMDRWPPRPMPTQEELAAKHQTTPTRLKAFFNRTLKAQGRRLFDEEALAAHAGITESDTQHLWLLLCQHGEE